jgi:hypothetical protein
MINVTNMSRSLSVSAAGLLAYCVTSVYSANVPVAVVFHFQFSCREAIPDKVEICRLILSLPANRAVVGRERRDPDGCCTIQHQALSKASRSLFFGKRKKPGSDFYPTTS